MEAAAAAGGGTSDHKKLTELHKHLLHHRELFLSRQIETHKIDMVRCVTSNSCLCAGAAVDQFTVCPQREVYSEPSQ